MLTLAQQAAWRDVIRQIKRAVPMRQALRMVGWRVRGRRAQCGLKKHSDPQAVAFNDQFWNCHACNKGGDQITLIELAHGCSRGDAIKFLAQEARVELPSKRQLRAEEKRQWAKRKQREEEIDALNHAAAEEEQHMRNECTRRIRECNCVLSATGPWSEPQWQRARAAHTLREEFLLPEDTLLSFAALEQRLCYLAATQQERAAMLAALRWAGGVVADDHHFVEVMT